MFNQVNIKNKYTCEKGHSYTINGTYVALLITNDTGTYEYNYCMQCFGEWAKRNWPIVCEEIKE